MTPCARRKVIIAPTVLWLIFIWMEMASYDVDICSLSFLLTAHRRHPGSRTRSCYVCSRPRSFTVWIREFVQLSPGVGLLGSFCSCPHTQGCTRHLCWCSFWENPGHDERGKEWSQEPWHLLAGGWGQGQPARAPGTSRAPGEVTKCHQWFPLQTGFYQVKVWTFYFAKTQIETYNQSKVFTNLIF